MGYSNAEAVEIDPPEVGTDSLKDELDNVSLKMQGIDWVYEQIRGQSLYDELIKPLAGDFNRIRANGDAWEKVGLEGLERVSNNLTSAQENLVNNHWTSGDAAAAFSEHIEGVWFGALYSAAYVCTWVKKGFEVLADKSIAIGRKAAEWLEELVDLCVKLASKMVPGGGWAKGVVDLFTGELVDQVNRVIDLAQAIIGLQGNIENIVQAANSYVEGAQNIGEAVAMIPDISSGNDAVATARKFGEGTRQVNEANNQVRENTQGLDGNLDTIRNTNVG